MEFAGADSYLKTLFTKDCLLARLRFQVDQDDILQHIHLEINHPTSSQNPVLKGDQNPKPLHFFPLPHWMKMNEYVSKGKVKQLVARSVLPWQTESDYQTIGDRITDIIDSTGVISCSKRESCKCQTLVSALLINVVRC